MARYHKKDLIYFKKDGKPTIAVITDVDNNYNVTSVMALDQAGNESHIWFEGRSTSLAPFKLITDKVYNQLTPEQQDIVDNFDFDLAVRNFRELMMNRNK